MDKVYVIEYEHCDKDGNIKRRSLKRYSAPINATFDMTDMAYEEQLRLRSRHIAFTRSGGSYYELISLGKEYHLWHLREEKFDGAYLRQMIRQEVEALSKAVENDCGDDVFNSIKRRLDGFCYKLYGKGA